LKQERETRARKTCQKCTSEMEPGLIPDRGYNYTYPEAWVEGEGEKGWLGLKLKNKRLYAISAYRCTKCGFLETYATKPADLAGWPKE